MAFFSPLSLFDVPVAPRRYCVVKRQPSLSDELNTLLTPFLLGDALSPKHKAKPKPRPAKWVECVQLPGFAPREVKAEVKGRKVVIVGKSVEGDGDNKNVYHVKRTVVLPPDVDASKVTCHYVPRRFVLVEGPRVCKTPQDSRPAVRVVPVSQPSEVNSAPCKDGHVEKKKRKAEDVKTPDDSSGDGVHPPEKRRCESEKSADTTQEEEKEEAVAEMETAPAESEDKPAAATDPPCPESERTCSDDTDAVSTRAEAGDPVTDVDAVDIEDDEEEDDCSEEEQMVNILKPSSAGADNPPAAPTTQTPTPAAPAAAPAAPATAPAAPEAPAAPATAPAAPEAPAADDATAVSKTTQSEPPARPAHFELSLNLTGFCPEDVTVSRDGSDVIIEAERVEKRGESASRQVFRQVVTLPDNVDAEQLRSFLRDDGQLTMTAPYCRASTDVLIPIRVE